MGILQPSWTQFPPHTRGWTQYIKHRFDGLSVSPHTRGWTAGPEQRHPHLPVSPAHAGMDRTVPPSRTPRRSFPRTRGDGPMTLTAFITSGRFPPHTRGWTGLSCRHSRLASVSPAHAGMDRLQPATGEPYRCFPRTRGDGPVSLPKPSSSPRFPPHTRGWTCTGRHSARSPVVSPAHAGMDRMAPLRIASGRCFPRTRGDGPVTRRTRPGRLPFPPHTRGWTAPVCHVTI